LAKEDERIRMSFVRLRIRRSQVRVLPSALRTAGKSLKKQRTSATQPILFGSSRARKILFRSVVATFGGMALEPNVGEWPVVKVRFDEIKEQAPP
jgi:hypothetical protein